jgi:hypothetical protein
VNQLSPEAFGWVLGFLTTVDSRDQHALLSFFAERCTSQVNNDPLIEGRASVVRRLAYLAPSFRTREHELLNAYGTERAIALEGLSHCSSTDATPVAVRAAMFIDRDNRGLVTSIRLYTDTTDLYVRHAGGDRPS